MSGEVLLWTVVYTAGFVLVAVLVVPRFLGVPNFLDKWIENRRTSIRNAEWSRASSLLQARRPTETGSYYDDEWQDALIEVGAPHDRVVAYFKFRDQQRKKVQGQ